MVGLIGFDWGISSLCVYWFDVGGVVVEVCMCLWGICQLLEGGFDVVLVDVIVGWFVLLQLVCGMVGSCNGWCEVLYLDLLVDVGVLGCVLYMFVVSDGGVLYLVFGLCNLCGLDVMCGEEIQLVGVLVCDLLFVVYIIFVLLGMYSKWVSVCDGIIVDFSMMMIGELFVLLCWYLILSVGIGEGILELDVFVCGVVVVCDSGVVGVLLCLFLVCVLMFDGVLVFVLVLDYFFGLLLGEELCVQIVSGWFCVDVLIQLIGDVVLCVCYCEVVVYFEFYFVELLVDIVVVGFWQFVFIVGLLIDFFVVVFKEVCLC